MTATSTLEPELMPYEALIAALAVYRAAVLEHEAAKAQGCAVSLARASCLEAEARLGIVDVWLSAYR